MDSFSLMVESVSALATMAAVFVALKANHNANIQLKKALEMHSQTKELAVLEQRLELLDAIEKNLSISYSKISLFFGEGRNAEIKRLVSEYQKFTREMKCCEAQEDLFWIALENNKREDFATIKETLSNLKDNLMAVYRKGYQLDFLEQEFHALCNENVVPSVLQHQEDSKVVNYYNIYLDYLKAEKNFDKSKTDLCTAMKSIIEKSLLTIS